MKPEANKRKRQCRLAPATCSAWAAIWHSKNKLDGETHHIIHHNLLPAMFKTRKQTLAFIEKEYGYIRHRRDLQTEPHGWRMPKPMRVTITPNGTR
jgi:hypothetical protein